MAAVVVVTGAGTLCGCGTEDAVEERSFTDRSGRACTYVLVRDREQEDEVDDLDARNIDCDHPPSPSVSRGARP